MMEITEAKIKAHSIPYESKEGLNQLVDAIGDAKIVLLGEASHGTAEFYNVRAQLTKRLIKEKSFSIIAVEGDWPACQQVNRYIKNFDHINNNSLDLLKSFHTWPTWMWANEEAATLIDWLKKHNENAPLNNVGFYGIDIYSLYESMEELFNSFRKGNRAGEEVKQIKEIFNCFLPYKSNPDQYALSTLSSSTTCEAQVSKFAEIIRQNYENYAENEEQNLNLLMNASILQNAEAYYRASTERSSLSWNIRDTHMVETINNLLMHHGEDSKVIVWAHNTHIGDASATTMTKDGSINIGQLLREQYEEKEVFAIGFGTYSGTVIAADDWGDPFEVMNVPPAKKGSWEYLVHKAGAFDKYLIFNDHNRDSFNKWTDHRAIGVTYNSNYEQYNYVPSQISNRYDAFIHIDQTTALTPHTDS